MSHAPLRLGVRASRLGQNLGERIIDQLRPHVGTTAIEIVPIEDVPRHAWPGAALEHALVKGTIDIAVQNVKDLPIDGEPGLVLAAVTERFTPFDVLIARDETIMDELPDGSAISAHTPLRHAQLIRYRPDLMPADLPGSLDDRIRALDAGKVDGLIVSASAVEHLGYQDRVTEIFTTEVFVPAAGQGTCVLQMREGGKELLRLAKHLDHPIARSEIEAERAFVRALKADPTMAVGALASIDGARIRLEGVAADFDGRKLIRDVEEGKIGDEEGIGERLARRLLLEGARKVLPGAGLPGR